MTHWHLNLFWIALGGALGSVLRFACSAVLQERSGLLFPVGTLAVNVLGSLAIGFFVARAENTVLAEHHRMAVQVGLLGGFTTFSSFSLETIRLLEQRALWSAAINVTASMICCLLGCWLGLSLARGIGR